MKFWRWYSANTCFLLYPVAEPKDFVYLLDNCPHDWLFLQCSAVVSLSQLLLVFLYLLAIQ